MVDINQKLVQNLSTNCYACFFFLLFFGIGFPLLIVGICLLCFGIYYLLAFLILGVTWTPIGILFGIYYGGSCSVVLDPTAQQCHVHKKKAMLIQCCCSTERQQISLHDIKSFKRSSVGRVYILQKDGQMIYLTRPIRTGMNMRQYNALKLWFKAWTRHHHPKVIHPQIIQMGGMQAVVLTPEQQAAYFQQQQFQIAQPQIYQPQIGNQSEQHLLEKDLPPYFPPSTQL